MPCSFANASIFAYFARFSGVSVLDVVIDREDRLRRIRDRGCADLLELRNHRAGVVMRHHVARTNRDEIAAANHRSRRQSIRVPRRNLLNKRQTHI